MDQAHHKLKCTFNTSGIEQNAEIYFADVIEMHFTKWKFRIWI